MQEEFSCQVMQGIGQSCTYTVYAVRCGVSAMSEPLEVHVPGKLGFTSQNGIMSKPCRRYDTFSSMTHN